MAQCAPANWPTLLTVATQQPQDISQCFAMLESFPKAAEVSKFFTPSNALAFSA